MMMFFLRFRSLISNSNVLIYLLTSSLSMVGSTLVEALLMASVFLSALVPASLLRMPFAMPAFSRFYRALAVGTFFLAVVRLPPACLLRPPPPVPLRGGSMKVSERFGLPSELPPMDRSAMPVLLRSRPPNLIEGDMALLPGLGLPLLGEL